MIIRLLACGVLLAAIPACGGGPEQPNSEEERLGIEEVGPDRLLPGTRLRVRGGPFRKDDAVTFRFDGKIGGSSVAFARRALFQNREAVFMEVDDGFHEALGAESGTFRGTLEVEVDRGEQMLRGTRDVEFELTESLEPTIESVQPKSLAFMDQMEVRGSNLLLTGEGRTILRAQGTFTTDGGERQSVEDLVLPLEPDRRNRSIYVHTPEPFGLHPGRFEGTFTVENWHDGSGEERAGNSLSVSFEVPAPRLDTVEPKAVSRGQRLRGLGVGFVPRTSDARQRTSLILEGTFTDTDGSRTSYTGANAITLETEFRESGVVEHVVRPSVQNDELVGFGSTPGVFEGEVRARILRGERSLQTPSRSLRLKVLPTKQVVYLKFLPGFSDSLRKFGLRNVEQNIRDRVHEVCERDFEEYHVSCRMERPEKFADYTVIEIGGRDPNNGSLFGLDNSEGVDRGNHRLDEVIGGRRATDDSGENFSYGGVFIESFLVFSPTLTESVPIESPRFDDIFGPFIPELDGKPVQVDEYPSGSRSDEIAKAIRVLGNLVGNTAVHEVGHALGLANTGVPDQVHHQGLKPNLIMNRGVDRSFELRAEIDGKGPGIWGKRDSRYLERVLPKP